VIGLFRGDVGDAIWLTGVKPDDIRSLARKYWIDKIDLAPPAKKL